MLLFIFFIFIIIVFYLSLSNDNKCPAELVDIICNCSKKIKPRLDNLDY